MKAEKLTFKDVFNLEDESSFCILDGKKTKFDQPKGHPRGIKTIVEIRNKETGELVFVGKNRTMIAGSEFMAMKMFNLPHDTFITPTYNNALNLDNTVNTQNPENMYCVQLFCIGTSGCNRESSLVYEVDNKHWIYPDELVPFQYVPYSDDLTTTERNMYFGRKSLGDRQFYAYYFKKPDSDPVCKKQLEDGTPIDSTIYDDTSTLHAQVLVTLSLSITKDDGRDYFINTTGINDGRFNCLSLCAAWTKVISSYTYYQDIRPFTRINFPNKMFSDLGASWDIVYRLYF